MFRKTAGVQTAVQLEAALRRCRLVMRSKHCISFLQQKDNLLKKHGYFAPKFEPVTEKFILRR
jgi:hypothetical protein